MGFALKSSNRKSCFCHCAAASSFLMKLNCSCRSVQKLCRVNLISQNVFLDGSYQSKDYRLIEKKYTEVIRQSHCLICYFIRSFLVLSKVAHHCLKKIIICSLSVFCSPWLILTISPQISVQNKSEVKITNGFLRM